MKQNKGEGLNRKIQIYNWSSACLSDKNLLYMMAELFNHHPNLLPIVLDPKLPRPVYSSEKIKKQALSLSSGEELLIRMGLDIWDGSGHAKFLEISQVLDLRNFINSLIVLARLRGISSMELVQLLSQSVFGPPNQDSF